MLNNVGRTLLLITCLYKICFYNVGFIGSNNVPLTIQVNAITRKSLASNNVDFSGKLLDSMHLLVTWTSWVSWTFGSLKGTLGLLTS